MAFLIITAAAMLVFPRDVMQSAEEMCGLFARAVLPGLFPFMTVMLLITSRLKPGSQLGPVVLMGLCSGSPAGARLTGLCDFPKKTYRALAHATAVMSPMFILGTLAGWLNGYGVAMLLASTLAALLTAGFSLLLPMKGASEHVRGSGAGDGPMRISEAINRAAQTMLTVCGSMVMAGALLTLFVKLFPIQSALLRALLAGALEVTRGAHELSDLALLDARLAPSLCIMLASFGGVSLMLQNYAFYEKGALPLIPYMLLKLLQAGLAFVICYAIAPFFEGPASAVAVMPVAFVPAWPLLVWLSSFFLSEIMLQWSGRRNKGAMHASFKQPQGRAGR